MTRRLPALVLVLASLIGCGKVVPRPAEPEPEVAGVQPRSSAPEPATPARERGRLRMAWRRQTPPFVQAIAVDRQRVALLSSQRISLYDLASGGARGSTAGCRGALALGFASAERLLVVCEGEVQVRSAADLALRQTQPLDGRATLARVVGDVVAVAFEQGPLRIFDLDGWKERAAVPVDQAITSLAISSDGARVALGLEQGDVAVVAEGAPPTRATVTQALAVETLAFSPDGAELFAAAGVRAKVWPATLGPDAKTLRTIGGVLVADWLGPHQLITAGREGLVVVGVDSGRAGSLAGYVEGVSPVTALARDGEVLCIAERDGEVSCFSRGRLGGSKQVVLADRPGGPGAEAMAGHVVSLERTRLSIQLLAGSPAPEPDSTVSVERYVEQRVGKLREARWLSLAAGKVFKVAEGQVFIRLDAGIKPLPGVKDAFAPGTPVRLVWGP